MGLHPTPVVIGIRSHNFREEEMLEESDDGEDPQNFRKTLQGLTEAWESALHKRSRTHTLSCPIANKALASMAFRHYAPIESFQLDVVIAEAGLVREVTISPQDPSAPWRKDNAGHLSLQGSDISLLVDSPSWEGDVRERKRQHLELLQRSEKREHGRTLKEAMSIEFFVSLLCRYNIEGTAILSTWDPCGAEQAAACRLDRSSLSFMGLSTTQAVDSLDFDRFPLLR
eukprot:jgi/Undpi1/7155/HiC_scaffold_22.g09629.m1